MTEASAACARAIALANSTSGDDVIEFDPGFFGVHRDIDLASPLPTIFSGRGALTIAGPGAANLTVNAGNAFRVLESAAPALNLSEFTITGGLASYSDGGGLKASGIVDVGRYGRDREYSDGLQWRLRRDGRRGRHGRWRVLGGPKYHDLREHGLDEWWGSWVRLRRLPRR